MLNPNKFDSIHIAQKKTRKEARFTRIIKNPKKKKKFKVIETK